MAKVYVSVEELTAALALQDYVNSVPLEDVVWSYEGARIPVEKEAIDDWKFVGLSNWAFAEYHHATTEPQNR